MKKPTIDKFEKMGKNRKRYFDKINEKKENRKKEKKIKKSKDRKR